MSRGKRLGMRAAALLCSVLLASACNRSEERVISGEARSASEPPRPTLAASAAPESVPAAPATPTAPATPPAPAPAPATPAAPASAASAPPPCLIPTPKAPPPKAARATSCPADPGPAPTLPRGSVTFPDAPGAPRIDVEIAREESHRSRGLMYRRHMPEAQGMIFSWSRAEPRTFWMHNTCTPLDMLFIALDGTILGILEEVPVLNDDPRGIPCPAGHVLEVNAGWCRRHGVKAGMHIAIQ